MSVETRTKRRAPTTRPCRAAPPNVRSRTPFAPSAARTGVSDDRRAPGSRLPGL